MQKKLGFFSWFKTIYHKLIHLAKKVTLPGLEKVPVYDVGIFYKNGITNGAIGVRAGAISFSFFMAIFPSIIFIFTLIPFIPIPNFQTELIKLIEELLPSNTYLVIENTIVDITTHRRLSLLSFGFIAAMFFSTNGISAMIAAFNASANAFENRSWLSMRGISIVLVFIIFILTTVATSLVIFGREIINLLVESGLVKTNWTQVLFSTGRWLIITIVALLSVSFLYYYAPSKRSRYRFFSPGSIMATLLLLITSLGFSYYISHFGRYNKLYGSIGTLLALLIWFNINAFVLLIGFELNVSIRNARFKKTHGLELSANSVDYEKYYPRKEELLKDL